MKKFNQVLELMGNQLELHAKFLNTLSLLEFIGSRKIVKSQNDREITEELLAHVAEEIRHAQVLKHIALKMSQGSLKTYQENDLLASSAGKAYIQSVDHAVEKKLVNKDVWVNYLLTTLLVEERAAEFYPIYNEVLGRLGFPNKLTGIMRDEERHLESVTASISKDYSNAESMLNDLREFEARAFDSFMDGVILSLR